MRFVLLRCFAVGLLRPNPRQGINAGGGASYVLEASTNLSTWTPLLTNSSSVVDFTDPNTSGIGAKLYRLRQVP